MKNQRRIFPVCAALNGEYGLKDLHLGVPVVLGKNGIEKVIELKLNDEEMSMVRKSARDVVELMRVLDDLDLFKKKYSYKSIV